MLFSEREDMSTAIRYEKPADISGIGAVDPPCISPEAGLSVFVVFPSMNWALRAMEKAREMAVPLGARIVVVALQVVPYPLPLDKPPIPIDFLIRRFQEKAGEFSGRTRVAVYLCRDPLAALKSIVSPERPIVIGIKKRLWPTRNERLARKLRHAGYSITLVETE
jgi:hypothetical protein